MKKNMIYRYTIHEDALLDALLIVDFQAVLRLSADNEWLEVVNLERWNGRWQEAADFAYVVPCRAVSCRAMFRFKAPFNGGERPVSNWEEVGCRFWPKFAWSKCEYLTRELCSRCTVPFLSVRAPHSVSFECWGCFGEALDVTLWQFAAKQSTCFRLGKHNKLCRFGRGETNRRTRKLR